MRFEKLAIYTDARELYGIAHETAEALSDQYVHIADMLKHHAATVTIKIAGGSAAISRDDAYRTFRSCQRSAELCHSIFERLELAQLSDPDTIAEGIRISDRIQIRAHTIIERIRQKLPPREVFRD